MVKDKNDEFSKFNEPSLLERGRLSERKIVIKKKEKVSVKEGCGTAEEQQIPPEQEPTIPEQHQITSVGVITPTTKTSDHQFNYLGQVFVTTLFAFGYLVSVLPSVFQKLRKEKDSVSVSDTFTTKKKIKEKKIQNKNHFL